MLWMRLLIMFAALAVLSRWSFARDSAEGDRSTNSQTAKMIADTLTQSKDLPASERVKVLQDVAQAVRERHPNNVLIAEQLQTATTDQTLEGALRKSYEILTFQVKKEADLPAGFPDPTPLGEIRVKQYPAYRLARTASQKNSGFFKLFTHITLNRIEMTAPVEMTYRSGEKVQPEQVNMAFLYGNMSLGKTGSKLGGVTVQDIPAMTTVSIGMRGDIDRVNLTDVERRLETWLAQHAADRERAGDLRVLGYNSPQVRSESRYWEVELPIK